MLRRTTLQSYFRYEYCKTKKYDNSGKYSSEVYWNHVGISIANIFLVSNMLWKTIKIYGDLVSRNNFMNDWNIKFILFRLVLQGKMILDGYGTTLKPHHLCQQCHSLSPWAILYHWNVILPAQLLSSKYGDLLVTCPRAILHWNLLQLL